MTDYLNKLRETSVVTEKGCWKPLSGATVYRYIRVDGKPVRAHRYVAGATPGDIVLHSCDNPWCCNPEHLSIGTQADNMLDMNTKGRHPSRKLTDADVLYVLSSECSTYSLAKKFNVSTKTIHKIRKGETYVRLQ